MSQPHPHAQPSEHHDTATDAAHPKPMAPEAEIAENAQRPVPQKPEGSKANLVPQEPPVIKPPIQSATPQNTVPAAPVEQVEHLVLDKEALTLAEQKLANYIGQHIDARLTKGLVLNLKEHANNGKAGIELCFKGPHLVENSALFGEQVLAALKQHPAFAEQFKVAATTPHAVKPHEAEKVDMMHVHVNHLSTHDYVTIIRNLAQDVQPIKPQHEQVLKSKGTAISAQKKETANDHPAPTIKPPSRRSIRPSRTITRSHRKESRAKWHSSPTAPAFRSA